MGDDTLTIFFAHADAVAQRIREWNEYRLKQEIAAQKRTIDIQIDKASDTKAIQIAQQHLKGSTQWVQLEQQRQKLNKQRFEQFKEFVFWLGGWVGSGRSGIFFFICGVLISATATAVVIINLPTFLSCPNSKSLCYQVYQMRFNNQSVILPGQAKDIVAEYERNKRKSKRRK
ncbi:MAG: hypothetical protein RM368_12920 [Nostoc sp. DedSLP03]|uniref:hypothetical protein n=1 Tax=Nostoc sp. DedSLP03 TaxID=3075400 RepID=UPI002AD32B96|nr:hypothetical protein [Nostoc sp. DedSLP03]MDZ7965858.1 hypothetical protein [Nostoc sp. DedSLP03]